MNQPGSSWFPAPRACVPSCRSQRWGGLGQLSRAPAPGGHARRGGAAADEEGRGEADVVFGRAVDVRAARHAREGVELRGQHLGIAADPQGPLRDGLRGPHGALRLVPRPLAHKVLLGGQRGSL